MDRRTVRTRRWLREALIDLMKEKPYEAITVHEITDRADTARVTFYRNFTDKDALLHSCLDEFRKELEPALQSPILAPSSETGKIMAHNLTEFYQKLDEHREPFKVLLQGSVLSIIREQMKNYFVVQAMMAFQTNGIVDKFPVPLEIVVNFMAEAHLGLVIWWITSDDPQPADVVAETAIRLSEEGLFGITGEPALVSRNIEERTSDE
ncbi:MAG: TetR/AcrR family transcriptional regulator [Chloroflexota bacterium]